MAKKYAPNQESEALISKELDAIKRLLVLQLITSGVQAKDIALALGVSQMTVSRLVASRRIKKTTTKN